MTPADTSVKSKPAWQIATLFPDQGEWSDEDYLELDTNHLVEFTDGNVEVLPMPTQVHQAIARFLFLALVRFIEPARLGEVFFAPLRLRVRKGKFREPDVLFMLARNAHRRGNKFWQGADLVIEVVSEDDPDRDYVRKVGDYAEAGVPEYWIVDPVKRQVSLLTLGTGGSYAEPLVRRAGNKSTPRC